MGMGIGVPLAVTAQGTTNSPSSNSLKGALTSIQNDPTDNSLPRLVILLSSMVPLRLL
ncbi:MAG TPA: hypothetical protein VFR94_03230 [Nitrososphaeraceae archaeon]|nr:hypothetical protein [Nitrososphaeraceae archaeon]